MDRILLRVVVVRNHPVILSEFRSELPVLALGFWVVELLNSGTAGIRRPERSELVTLSAVATTDLFCLGGLCEKSHQHLDWSTLESVPPRMCE